MNSINLLIIGAPNSGKGTASGDICRDYGLYHFSTGDMLRENIASSTQLGKLAKSYMDKGMLVPDDVIINMVEAKLGEDVCKNGVLFDGFPRTLSQAKALDKLININAVLYLDVDDETVVERAVNRRVCSKCKKIYKASELTSNVCGECGGEIITRADDTREVALSRVQTYKTETFPLVEYYAKKVVKIDASRRIDEVQEEIKQKLKKALGK